MRFAQSAIHSCTTTSALRRRSRDSNYHCDPANGTSNREVALIEPPSKSIDTGRVPLRSVTNIVSLVDGKTPRKARIVDKENIRAHHNIPRLYHPRIDNSSSSFAVAHEPQPLKAAEPASPDWESEKVLHLRQVREWSETGKTRHQSLPAIKPVPAKVFHRASLPIRVAEPTTYEWESEKVIQLRRAREWSETVKTRPRSLPTPTLNPVPVPTNHPDTRVCFLLLRSAFLRHPRHPAPPHFLCLSAPSTSTNVPCTRRSASRVRPVFPGPLRRGSLL
ncbi:hypothetical protein K438DRAFT_1795708 [Mycena galopus ATCC 62051]|nr:hypothetical protein K438DRAFT_1795708 [Mycena galopus ATCC 62051]